MRPGWDIPDSGPLDRTCELILDRIAGRSGSPGFGASQGGIAPPIASVRDVTIPGPGGVLPLRLYLPEPRQSPALLVWLHGGGFVSGGLDSHDVQLRTLADTVGCAVIAVDYRLAPSHPWPAATQDAVAALLWASGHALELGADPDRLAVGGDSAGGNLAAVASMMCRDQVGRDRGAPDLCLQVLVYPDGDARRGFNQDSWREHDGLILDRVGKDHALDRYLPAGIDRQQPQVSPALSPVAALRGLPPALILTAEFDPQRDEGELYAARLREAGVPVSLTRYSGMIHGFWQMGGLLAQAGRVNRQIAEALARPSG